MSDNASLTANRDDRVAEVLDVYLEAMKAGVPPDVDELLARYPDLADDLKECLASLAFIRQAEMSASRSADKGEDMPSADDFAGVLGDFRMVREVGKGGMGVVYEAEQISLRRRVALKVLPFAATLDARQLQRFHNEAQAAACLHHTNIVPVFSVGCERGVHFYAMQYIDGQPLSELIRQMRQREKKPPAVARGEPTAAYPTPADAVASTPLPAAGIAPLTGEGRRGSDYFRKVAELGVQAAEALDHAHQLGIVHRDIKPSNLMLDGRGNLWVTDFGLAHMQHGEANLTLTGQAVGTPRYMSPEQALAKRVLLDHRTDVYSLGATLYELLTLHPAFESEDRQELLQQIAFEEPRPPRRCNKAIPAELENIVLKAMAKNPSERYATAGELADDLRRWLEDRPIRARRPPMRTQLVRWAWRHRTFVVSAAAALVMGLAVLAGSVGWIVRDQAARQAKRVGDIEVALKDAKGFRREGKLPMAQAAAKRAETLLQDGVAAPALAEQVQNLLRELAEEETDSRLVADLAELRLRQAAADVKENRYHLAKSRPDYQQVFGKYGLRRETMTAEEAAARIQARPAPIRATLVAALDHWLILARYEEAPEADWLERILSTADPDSWRQRLRAARIQDDRKALEQLATEDDAFTQPPEALYVLQRALRQRDAKAAALALLRRAQQTYPADFWVNHDLGCALRDCQPPRYVESIRFLTAAVALRPESAGTWLTLGDVLTRTGRLDEAADAFRQAIRLSPDYAWAHLDLGVTLWRKGRLDEASAAFRRAIELDPEESMAHHHLGVVLRESGRLDEAVASWRRAIELNPNLAMAHCYLGLALQKQGNFAHALVALKRGHELGLRRSGWPFPSAQWVRQCQRLVELDGREQAVLRGEVQLASAAERNDYALLCYCKKLYAASARLWAEAYAADPKLADDWKAGHRYNAACAAALAGCGRGKDADKLDTNERARLRRQALDWLRADLKAHQQEVENSADQAHWVVVRRMQHWLKDEDFAGLRGSASLARLPEAERGEWQKLWQEVETLRQRAAERPASARPARP